MYMYIYVCHVQKKTHKECKPKKKPANILNCTQSYVCRAVCGVCGVQ